MPVLGLYWVDASCIGPVHAEYWQLTACLQGMRYIYFYRVPTIILGEGKSVWVIHRRPVRRNLTFSLEMTIVNKNVSQSSVCLHAIHSHNTRIHEHTIHEHTYNVIRSNSTHVFLWTIFLYN